MTESEVKYLFTYGTLAPGEDNHHHVEHIDGDWMQAAVRGRLVDQGWGADLGFPALVVDENGDWIQGWALRSKCLSQYLAALDEFEGDEYQRKPVAVTLENHEVVQAYVYLAKNSN